MFQRRLSAAAIALFLAANLARAGDVPAVLEHVPANAQAVFVIKDLKGLAAKVTTMGTRLGLPLPEDPIDVMTHHIGVAEGLDKKGSMAVVIMPGMKTEDDDEATSPPKPEPILLIPTTDADAMLKPFKPGTAKGGVSKVLMPNDPDETGFVAKVGNFVAFSTQRAFLDRFLAQNKMLPETLSPESIAAINGNDVALYANVPELSKAYGTFVDSLLQFAAMSADLKSQRDESVVGGIATKEFMNSYFKAVRNFLTDAKSTLITARIADNGLTLGAAGNFAADSAWGKYLAAVKSDRPLSLTGLPNAGTLWAAGSIYMNSGNFSSILNGILERLGKEKNLTSEKEKRDLEMTAKAVTIEKQMAELSTGGSFAVYAPTDVEKHGYVNALFFVETSDAAKYMELARNVLQLGGETAPGVTVKVDEKREALKVEGISVDRYKITVSGKANEDGESPAELLAKITGPEGVIIHLAPVGNRVLVVISSEEKLVASAVTALAKNSDELFKSEEIQSVKDEGLKNPSLMLYACVDRVIAFAEKSGRKPRGNGATLPVELKDPATSPVVLTASTSGQSAKLEVFVPVTTLGTTAKYLIKTLAPLMGQGEE